MSKRKTELGTARTQQLAEWLRLGLLKSGKKKGALAALLNLPPSAVSKILSAQREVREYELRIIAEYIEEPVPDALSDTGASSVVHVIQHPTWLQPSVIVAPGVWRSPEASTMRAERIPASPDPRLDGLQQYACYIESDGSCVTCVPYNAFRLSPQLLVTSNKSFACVGCLSTRGRLPRDQLPPVVSPTMRQFAAIKDVPGSLASM